VRVTIDSAIDAIDPCGSWACTDPARPAG
jgi:hypothetical protein